MSTVEEKYASSDSGPDLAVGLLTVALEGIEQGAVDGGLDRKTARALVRQTLLATALLLQDHPGSPADLKDQVASPGGTTIAGLAALEDHGVRGAFLRAMENGTRRRLDAYTRKTRMDLA